MALTAHTFMPDLSITDAGFETFKTQMNEPGTAGWIGSLAKRSFACVRTLYFELVQPTMKSGAAVVWQLSCSSHVVCASWIAAC